MCFSDWSSVFIFELDGGLPVLPDTSLYDFKKIWINHRICQILEKCSAIWWSSKGSVWSWWPFGEKEMNHLTCISKAWRWQHYDLWVKQAGIMRKPKLWGKYWSNTSRHHPGSEASAQMVLQNGQWAKMLPQLQSGLRSTKFILLRNNQKNPTEDWGADRKRCLWAKEPKTPDSVRSILWGGMGQNYSNRLWMYTKCLTPVIQI